MQEAIETEIEDNEAQLQIEGWTAEYEQMFREWQEMKTYEDPYFGPCENFDPAIEECPAGGKHAFSYEPPDRDIGWSGGYRCDECGASPPERKRA